MTQKKLKSLLIFSGQVRPVSPIMFNECLKDFCKHMDADIALFYWDEPGASMNHDVTRKTEVDLNIEEHLISAFKGFRIIKKCVSNEREMSLFPKQSKISKDKKYSPLTKNAIKQLYQIYKGNISSIDYTSYDVVLRCRFDSLFIYPFKVSDLEDDVVYNINHGRAFFKNRIYDIFFYGKPSAMIKMHNTFLEAPRLINENANNDFDARDACHLLYQHAIKTGLKVYDTSIRYTDTFRGESVSMYLAKLKYWRLSDGLKNEDFILSFALQKLKFIERFMFFIYYYKLFPSSIYLRQKIIVNNSSKAIKNLLYRIFST